jgi:DNA-binding MarR family transcriptional regulator
MRKNEPTIQQALAQKEYYKDLSTDLIEYILYNYSENKLLKYLIHRGYTQRDLVKELYFDQATVEEAILELANGYK